MSKLQVDDIVDKDDVSAPTFSKGAIVTGVTTSTSFSGNLTGNVTGTLTGTASGLAGSPDITVGDVGSTNETISKQLTAEHTNITGVTTAVTLNATTSTLTNTTVSKQLTVEHTNATGVITATSFTGDGGNLTGLNIPSSFTWIDSNLF